MDAKLVRKFQLGTHNTVLMKLNAIMYFHLQKNWGVTPRASEDTRRKQKVS